jgi:hypothetical protein
VEVVDDIVGEDTGWRKRSKTGHGRKPVDPAQAEVESGARPDSGGARGRQAPALLDGDGGQAKAGEWREASLLNGGGDRPAYFDRRRG